MLRLLSYIPNISKLFAAIFLILNFQSISAKSRLSQIKQHKNTLYFGSFCPATTSDFCVLYDGELIAINDACFVIKDVMLGAINILLVDPEKIKFSTDENNIVLGLRLGTTEYKSYQLELTQLPVSHTMADGSILDQHVCSWKICEKNLDNEIPFNTIIIPLDPNKIAIELENMTSRPNNLAIKLPEIKLTTKCKQSLDQLMVEGYLKAVALKPFHSKQKIKSNIKNSTKISIIL